MKLHQTGGDHLCDPANNDSTGCSSLHLHLRTRLTPIQREGRLPDAASPAIGRFSALFLSFSASSLGSAISGWIFFFNILGISYPLANKTKNILVVVVIVPVT